MTTAAGFPYRVMRTSPFSISRMRVEMPFFASVMACVFNLARNSLGHAQTQLIHMRDPHLFSPRPIGRCSPCPPRLSPRAFRLFSVQGLLQLIAGKRRSGADAPEDLTKVFRFAAAQAALKSRQGFLTGNLCRHRVQIILVHRNALFLCIVLHLVMKFRGHSNRLDRHRISLASSHRIL